jgi:hypothetical protein
MGTIFDEPEKKKHGINKGFLVGGLIGVVLIGLLILVAMQRPSMEDQMAAVLADAYREGSPQFDEMTKDIIISTSDKTIEYANAFGGISMTISGRIRNKGTRTINGLEVNVAVVDLYNNTLKEKRVLVVPTQTPQLGPNEVFPITLGLDGFDKKDDRANIRWKVTAIRVP